MHFYKPNGKECSNETVEGDRRKEDVLAVEEEQGDGHEEEALVQGNPLSIRVQNANQKLGDIGQRIEGNARRIRSDQNAAATVEVSTC
jgi:hypothetical protein